MATEKKLLALALLLALAAPMLSAATLKDFISPYLYPGENYSSDVGAVQLAAGGSQYVLVKVKGTEAFFLSRTDTAGNETAYGFVNDTNRIYSALREYYAAQTYPNASELDDVILHLQRFNNSRTAAENECKSSTGLDRPGSTCAANRCESCMSVPFCGEKMPYFGDDFSLAIHNFEVDFKGMDSALANATAAANALKAGTVDAATYSAYILGNATIAQTRGRSEQANHMFGCYELIGSQMAPMGLEWCAYRQGAKANSQWCRDIPMNFSQLTEAITDSTAISGRMVSNSTAQSRAQALYNNMNSRANFVRMSAENASFREMYATVEERASNASRNAGVILARVSDDELSADLSALSELLLRVSQYGLDRNFSAANSTSIQLFVLSGKVEAEAENLSAIYDDFEGLNNETALSIFRARLYLDEQDKALLARLAGLEEEKNEVDRVIESGNPVDLATLAEFSGDLSFIKGAADGIVGEKQGARTLQAGAWAAAGSRAVSIFAINIVSGLLGLSNDAKESYARTLPTLAIVGVGVLAYAACIAFFLMLKAKGRIRLNRLSVILWVVIFAFLFVFMGVAVATANSVVQQEASRSTFGLFESRVEASNSTVIVLDKSSVPLGALPIFTSCGSALAANLSGSGKTVPVYTFDGANCLSSNGSSAGEACTRDISGVPTIVLGYSPVFNASFRVYYSTRALISGDASFYSSCMISRMFEEQ
ncbi:Uncharacterised protein [uncultured archaeon]|nr:Uncharacterised protein [uncultured archaeon]